MAILDIRGTHGSGKSYVVHSLGRIYSTVVCGTSKPRIVSIEEGGVLLGSHIPEIDCAVLGSYARVCGGCDGIKTADEVVRRVRMFAERYRNVVLEGILVAHTHSRYSKLATELRSKNYKFLFLNTPLETCIGRVRARRVQSGNEKELNTSNIVKDWWRILGNDDSVYEQMKTDGHYVKILDWEDPVPAFLRELDPCPSQ